MKLRHDLHVHLHGCLTADDLWRLGRDVWQQREKRLAWYVERYEAAVGRRPDPKSYWQTSDGLERLRHDFVFTDGGDFAAFQARFNLIIALLPITADDDMILKLVLSRDAQRGLGHVEYRCFLPPHFAAAQAATYLDTITQGAAHIAREQPGFQPRIALTIEREPQTAKKQYHWLRTWQESAGADGRFLTAIDFAGDEEDDPPDSKAALFAQIRVDNQRQPEQALAILCHVGETFKKHTLADAARRVAATAAAGAHRLGHAIALGCQTDNFDDQVLQEELMDQIALTGVVIESCPTSNCRIAALSDPTEHPLRRFLTAGLPVVLGTDDPGLLATDLDAEVTLCTELLGITPEEITQMATLAGGAARSGIIAGRPEEFA